MSTSHLVSFFSLFDYYYKRHVVYSSLSCYPDEDFDRKMLALSSIVALSVVAFFAYAGFMESFTRGMLVAATYKSNRPTRHHQPSTSTSLEPIDETPEIELTTAINMNDTMNINADGYMNISFTIMPTVNGSLQQVDLCRVENVIVPLSAHVDGQQPPKELTFKSLEFPFKRSNPLICSWNVKVSDNCRRGLVTMKINERSRLSGDKGCTKGYYRVSPFMKETKICGRIHNVPSFQWYVEDQQPENVTITLKHSGLNDGYSEGLGFTLSGECVPDESNLTISKAIKSYNNWMDQLISKRATDGLTVVLPGDARMPFDPVRLWQNRPNVTKGPIEFLNVTISDDSHPLTTQQSNSNQTDISHDETATSSHNVSFSVRNETDPIHLPITFVTHSPSPPPPATTSTTTTTPTTTTTEQSIETTTSVRPFPLIVNDDPEIPLLHHHNSPLTNNFPMIRRRPLPSTTTKKPIIQETTSRRPTLTIFPARKRPVAQIVDHPDEEIPWLILKSPPTASDPSLSYRIPASTAAVTPRPFHHQQEEVQQRRPVIRRPLVRLPSATVRPFDSPSTRDPDIPWVILKSPQRNKESSSSSTHYPPEKKPANVPTTKVPIVDDDGIPWLILKSPDPQTSAEIHYPNIPSNELNKRRRSQSFSGYYL